MARETQRLESYGIDHEPTGDCETALQALKSEYFGDLSQYGELAEARQDVYLKIWKADEDTARRMVEMAVLASVTSVRTVTERWETEMRAYLRGQQTAEEFAENTRDGEVKAEKIDHVFNSDIPRQAGNALRSMVPDKAVRILCGRETDDIGDTYLRTTKAHFAVWLLGFDRVCVDHRIHRALKPVMAQVLGERPGRPLGARVDAERLPPTDVDYWHDRLMAHPEIYDTLTSGVVEYVAEHTGIPEDRVPQVAFNTGGDGPRTTHERLFKILAG